MGVRKAGGGAKTSGRSREGIGETSEGHMGMEQAFEVGEDLAKWCRGFRRDGGNG